MVMVQYRGTLWYSGTILWYRWRLLAPLAEEGLEAGLGELDDLHVPGLGRLHAAHVLLPLAAEARAVEEVAGGTPVQQGLQRAAVRWLLLAQPELVAVVLVVEDAGPRALVRRPSRRPVRHLRLGLRGGLHHLGRSLRGDLCLLGVGGGRGD